MFSSMIKPFFKDEWTMKKNEYFGCFPSHDYGCSESEWSLKNDSIRCMKWKIPEIRSEKDNNSEEEENDNNVTSKDRSLMSNEKEKEKYEIRKHNKINKQIWINDTGASRETYPSEGSELCAEVCMQFTRHLGSSTKWMHDRMIK